MSSFQARIFGKPIRPRPLGVCHRRGVSLPESDVASCRHRLGVALSLLMLIYRTSHPQGAVLGQLLKIEAYRDVQRHFEALTSRVAD